MNGEIELFGKKEDLGKGGVKVLLEWKVKKSVIDFLYIMLYILIWIYSVI